MPLNELGAPRLELVETLVEFLSLGRSERYIARTTPKRIPQVSDEAQALFGLKCVDIYGWHAHVVMIPPRSDNRVAVVRLTLLGVTRKPRAALGLGESVALMAEVCRG
jgi:hypothetical protein